MAKGETQAVESARIRKPRAVKPKGYHITKTQLRSDFVPQEQAMKAAENQLAVDGAEVGEYELSGTREDRQESAGKNAADIVAPIELGRRDARRE